VWVSSTRFLVVGLSSLSACLDPAGPPLGKPFSVAVELFEVMEHTE